MRLEQQDGFGEFGGLKNLR